MPLTIGVNDTIMNMLQTGGRAPAMDERSLFLLGILMVQSAHGYQINDFIEKNLIQVTDMKKATAYALLERMSGSGLVTVHTEQEGNRPPRKVFSITPEGQRQFGALLRQNLARADRPIYKGDVGLLFLDHLPGQEAASNLQLRLEHLRNQIEALQNAAKHHRSSGIALSIEHQILHTQLEVDWLTKVIDQLRETDSQAPIDHP